MNEKNNITINRSHRHRYADDRGAGRKIWHSLFFVYLALVALTAGMVLESCAFNSATGQRHLNLISESQEIAMGQQADKEIIATLGLYNDANLQSYVQKLGSSLAKNSERPNLPWTFRVVDDPVVNAFALPGGFIYVTRGLMSYVENEAQLAGVIGHEIGHVTAQHAVHSMSNQQLTQLGMTAGMVVAPKLQRYGQYVNAGLGLLYLKYSRNDESQADHLGFRYMVRADKDPRQMINVFAMLNRISQSGGGSSTPEWLASHPNPVNRSENFQKEIDTLSRSFSQLVVNQEGYYRLIDGMVFGQNPREGFFRDNHFYHPELEFDVIFPSGWHMINQRGAVAAISPDQDAVLEITQAQGTSGTTAAKLFFDQKGIQSDRMETGSIHGLFTVSGNFLAETAEGIYKGKATFIEFNGNVYQLLGFSAEKNWSGYQNTIVSSIGSFRRLTDSKFLQMQPMRLKMITVQSTSSLSELAKQSSSHEQLETLAIINQSSINANFRAGERVKMVIGDNPGVLSQR